jgi:hypothetical protein
MIFAILVMRSIVNINHDYEGSIMKTTTKVYLSLISLITIGISGCASSPSYDGNTDKRWADFKKWTKITQGRTGTGDPTGLVAAVHKGTNGYRDVYVNNIALKTSQGSAPYSYPVGSVIVKEQFDDLAAFNSQQPTDLTIMVKLADNGSNDAKNWGWADAYNAELKPENAFCSSCHTVVLKDDFVFTNEDFLQKHKSN